MLYRRVLHKCLFWLWSSVDLHDVVPEIMEFFVSYIRRSRTYQEKYTLYGGIKALANSVKPLLLANKSQSMLVWNGERLLVLLAILVNVWFLQGID